MQLRLKKNLISLKTEFKYTAGWSSLVARQAHNLKVGGSNPSPATNPNNTFLIWSTFRKYSYHTINLIETKN